MKVARASKLCNIFLHTTIFLQTAKHVIVGWAFVECHHHDCSVEVDTYRYPCGKTVPMATLQVMKENVHMEQEWGNFVSANCKAQMVTRWLRMMMVMGLWLDRLGCSV